jgi:hypothetical protein
MRIKLAADLVKAYKKGDKTKCGTEVQNNQNSINAYCDKMFVEDPAQNIACKVNFGKYLGQRRFLFHLLSKRIRIFQNE